MDRDEFAAELRRMAENNGINFLKEDQLLQVMSNDIAAGADFINIIPSFADKNTFLVINTRSVIAVKAGVLGPKVAWSVPVAQIGSARPRRGMFRDYLIDEVRVETPSGAHNFRVGFFNPNYEMHKAELAKANAEVAANEITLAIAAQLPAASPPPTAGSNASEQPPNALAKQLRRFILSLAPLTGANSISKPFGEGLGLEGAMSLLPQSFDSVETLRRAGEMMAITIVGATGEGRINPDDVNYVMGVSNIRNSGLTPDQVAAADGLAGAAYTFLGQLDEPGTNMWELWKNRDDVAGEFLCWHAVAWGRLATLGRVDPVRDSDAEDETEQIGASDEDEEPSQLRPQESHPSTETSQHPKAPPTRPAGSAGPSLAQILAEWSPAAPEADLARWREGMTRYDNAPIENRAEMRASAELMCAALPHYLRGTDITAGTQGTSSELVQTIWNVLVASLLGNNQTTWDAQVERHMRLALAAARHAGLQPETLGGRGTFNQIFDDKGNQMLMLAALWGVSTSGPKAFTLQDWFASAPEERAWKVP
jgi:hypothetical protein